MKIALAVFTISVIYGVWFILDYDDNKFDNSIFQQSSTTLLNHCAGVCSLSAKKAGDVVISYNGDIMVSGAGQWGGNNFPKIKNKNVNIPAGKYTVKLESYDNFVGREDNPVSEQSQEKYYVILKNGNNELARTGITNDLEDGVEEAEKITFVNRNDNPITLGNNVNKITVVHAGPSNQLMKHGFEPVCMLLEKIEAKVDAACGTRSATYSTDTTDYPSGSAWCVPNNLHSKDWTGGFRAFPDKGKVVGWTCIGENGGADAVCKAKRKNIVCGDNVKNDNEQCDNGTRNGIAPAVGYGQTKTYCKSDCTNGIVVGGSCGDNKMNGTEECDSGVRNGVVPTLGYGQKKDYCTNDCQLITINGPSCGDSIKNGSEQCDDGNQNGVVPAVGYSETKTYCKSDCTNGTVTGGQCGNNVKEADEQCDKGNQNGDVCVAGYGNSCSYCDSTCQLKIIQGSNCGDKQINGQEQCDDGNQNGVVPTVSYGQTKIYCKSDCTNGAVVGGQCGNGITEDSEECDKGSQNGVVPAVGYGQNESYCKINCTLAIKMGESCGDGAINGSEQCDLENQNGVVPTVGYGETKTYCKSDCTNGTVNGGECGNGIKENDEQCDDENTLSFDGCSGTCQLEDSKIKLEKKSSETSIDKDASVTYMYIVTNNGSVELKDIKVVDDKLGIISCPGVTLDRGESIICRKTTTLGETTTNNATVSAKSIYNNEGVSSADSLTVRVEEGESEECEASIGNYIWQDINGNGIQEDIEEGIKNVKVCAYDGNKKYCDKTDKYGRYKIKDLCGDHTYQIIVKGIENMEQTYDPDGIKDNKTKVKLNSNDDDHTKADFGYRGIAPSTGVTTNMVVTIVLATLITLGMLVFMKKKRAL